MKTTLNIIGIILVAAGIAVFTVKSFTFTSKQNLASLGALKVTSVDKRTVNLPPLLGGISAAAGIVLIALANIRRHKHNGRHKAKHA